jgi:GNAT superfamily N-acetyltransferase
MASIIAHPGKQSESSRALCHVADPKKRRGYASVAVTRGGQTRTFSYAVVEPAHRGRKTVELDEVFAADEHIKYESSFAHRLIQTPPETSESPDTSTPFYGPYVPFAFGKFRHGLTRSAHEAHYCLVAQNGAGSPASFIAYSLALAAQSVALPGAKTTQLELRVALEQLYTRKRYRAKGAATALLQHLLDSVELELRHLLTQPAEDIVSSVTVCLAAKDPCATATSHLVRRLVVEGLLERLESIRTTWPELKISLGAPDVLPLPAQLKRTDSLQVQANAA